MNVKENESMIGEESEQGCFDFKVSTYSAYTFFFYVINLYFLYCRYLELYLKDAVLLPRIQKFRMEWKRTML